MFTMIQIYLNINVIIVNCLNGMQLKCIFWDCYAPDTVEDRKMKEHVPLGQTTRLQKLHAKREGRVIFEHEDRDSPCLTSQTNNWCL